MDERDSRKPDPRGASPGTAALRMLIVVTVFQAVSAVAGGIGILATNGLGMPSSLLEASPFTTFVWPGLILLVVIGGTQTLAAGLLLARHDSGLTWSSIAGFGMIIWIFTETGIIRGLSWLQVLYFATGCAQLALVVILLGGAAWWPRAPLPTHRGVGPRRNGR